jgi:hypothetical protein
MMAEYYALSIVMREVIPLRRLVQTVARQLDLDDKVMTEFKVTIWEDNDACTTLCNLDPGQTKARSKFYDSKVHWFRSYLDELTMVKRVDTTLQLADTFAKPLEKEIFEHLRKLTIGW